MSLFPKPVSWLGLFCRFLQETGSNKMAYQSRLAVRNDKKVPTKKLVWGMGTSEGAEWYRIDHKQLRGSLMLIYDQSSEPSDVHNSPKQFLVGTFFAASYSTLNLLTAGWN